MTESEQGQLVPASADQIAAGLLASGQPPIPSGFAQRQVAVLTAVREGSQPSRVYWLMNALATVIACYGLFANSAAVVIGAMVVAMLLGPIAGVALGLNEGEPSLLRTALYSLVGGIVWVFAISLAVGFIHQDVPLTAEILSRTDPRLFDLIIALAGGGAGAVAVLAPAIGTAIVGVAVATALVPPLAAAGILAARAEFALAGGALLFALTNIVAIQVAFSAVFWVGGYRRLTAIGEQGLFAFVRRGLPGLSLLAALAVVLGVQLHQEIARSLFESHVRAVLRQRFDDDGKFHLVDVRFAKEAGATVVRAVVRGPTAPTAAEVGTAQGELPAAPDSVTVRLRVRFVEIVIVTPQGQTVGGDKADP